MNTPGSCWKLCFWVLSLWLTGLTAHAQSVNASATFAVSQDWGAGANVTLWITNNGVSSITNNLLEFDFDHSITPYNNLRIASHVGNHFAMTNESYYPTVVPQGTSFHFDMQVNPGNLNGAQPTNYLINGLPLTGFIVPITLTVADASVMEGNVGSQSVPFAVTMSRAATNAVSVNFAAISGSAAAG